MKNRKKLVSLHLTLAVCLLSVAFCSLYSCKKVKNCRCAVKGSQSVRMIEIGKGSCEDLNYVLYNDPVHLRDTACDTLLCELAL